MRGHRLVVILLVFTFSMPVVAQRTGSLIGKTATKKDVDQVSRRFAQCLTNRRPEMVRAWLDVLPGSETEYKLSKKYETDLSVCLNFDRLIVDGQTLHYQTSSMRKYVVAEQMKRDFPSLPAEPPVQRGDEPWIVTKLNTAADKLSYNSSVAEMLVFAACVTRADWPVTAALLNSAVDSSAESGAIRALSAKFAGCLPAGMTLKVDRSDLRAILLEAAYHDLRAPASLTSSGL